MQTFGLGIPKPQQIRTFSRRVAKVGLTPVTTRAKSCIASLIALAVLAGFAAANWPSVVLGYADYRMRSFHSLDSVSRLGAAAVP